MLWASVNLQLFGDFNSEDREELIFVARSESTCDGLEYSVASVADVTDLNILWRQWPMSVAGGIRNVPETNGL